MSGESTIDVWLCECRKETTNIPIPIQVSMSLGSLAELSKQNVIKDMTIIAEFVLIFVQQRIRIKVRRLQEENMLNRPSLSTRIPGMILPRSGAPFNMETKYSASCLLIPCLTA